MTALAALAAGLVVLLVLAVATARRPERPLPDRDGYFDEWAGLHGGYDPRTGSAVLRGWLTGVLVLARPLARWGVHPDVLTLSTLWVAGAVVVVAGAGERWPAAAAWVLVLSGLLDNLDGAVAVLQRRTSRWGYVLDSAVDRVSDAAYLVAVVAAGAPLGPAVGCGFLLLMLEYVRARAGNAGGNDVGRITVAERPNRVIVLALSLLAAGLAPELAEQAVTAGVAVLTALTGVGLVQLLVAVRRQLRVLPPVHGRPDRDASA